jgi:hypothetical protein
MKRIDRRLTSVAATVAVTAGLVISGPALVANAEAAGQYTYVCVQADGNSYTMKHGTKTLSCHGTYLQQYINGKMIRAVPLFDHGSLTKLKPISKKSAACLFGLISVAGGTAAIVFTEGGATPIAVGIVSSGAIATLIDCTA